MRTITLSLLAFIAAACAQESPERPVEPPARTAAEATAQDICGASAFEFMVGTPASGIDQTTLPAGARIITPDMLVTQDFRPERLNIFTDTSGLVSSLSCF